MDLSNTSTTQDTKTYHKLVAKICQLVDIPENGIDCSTKDPTVCVQCETRGDFLTGESIDNYASTALVYYTITWAVTLLVSLLAIVTSVLMIKVRIKRLNDNRSFGLIQICLAIVDVLNCLATIVCSTAHVSYFGNWHGRGQGMLYWILVSLAFFHLFRTASTFLTVLISAQRFLIIAFEFEARRWITYRRTKHVLWATSAIILGMNFPRFFCWTVEKNNWKDINSLKDFDYFVYTTKTLEGNYIASNLHSKLDFLLGPILILLLNMLSFLKIREKNRQRMELTTNQSQQINASRMIIPQMIIHLMTYSPNLVGMYMFLTGNVLYREFYMVGFLVNVVNCAANLIINCCRSKSFENDVRLEIRKFFNMT